MQRQLTKVWWILMGLGVLMSVATLFYGGGYMIFAAWIFLVGLALVIHGLFSEQPLEWYGASMMLASVLLLAAAGRLSAHPVARSGAVRGRAATTGANPALSAADAASGGSIGPGGVGAAGVADGGSGLSDDPGLLRSPG